MIDMNGAHIPPIKKTHIETDDTSEKTQNGTKLLIKVLATEATKLNI